MWDLSNEARRCRGKNRGRRQASPVRLLWLSNYFSEERRRSFFLYDAFDAPDLAALSAFSLPVSAGMTLNRSPTIP